MIYLGIQRKRKALTNLLTRKRIWKRRNRWDGELEAVTGERDKLLGTVGVLVDANKENSQKTIAVSVSVAVGQLEEHRTGFWNGAESWGDGRSEEHKERSL